MGSLVKSSKRKHEKAACDNCSTTPSGTFSVSNRNTMTIDQRNQFLPVMKALLKVMESSRPTSRDVNKLLMYSRDLLKKIRGDKSNLSFIQFISNFYNFNNGKLNVIIEFFDLLMDGDVIVDVDGTPYVLTQIGAFPLSDVDMMTDEERNYYLPILRRFTQSLQNDVIDTADINWLLDKSMELSNKLQVNVFKTYLKIPKVKVIMK